MCQPLHLTCVGSVRQALSVSRTPLECAGAQDGLEFEILLLQCTSSGLACFRVCTLGNVESIFGSSNGGSFSGIGH